MSDFTIIELGAAAVLAMGIVVTGVCLTTHAVFLYLALGAQAVCKRWLARAPRTRMVMCSILLATSILVVSQSLQIVIWSGVFWAFGTFTSGIDALYFSATTYTTLGTGEHVLVPPFRLLEPLEAANGMLAGGLNTAVLFAILSDLARRHSSFDDFFC